jgi:hypothetical protein
MFPTFTPGQLVSRASLIAAVGGDSRHEFPDGGDFRAEARSLPFEIAVHDREENLEE